MLDHFEQQPQEIELGVEDSSVLGRRLHAISDPVSLHRTLDLDVLDEDSGELPELMF